MVGHQPTQYELEQKYDELARTVRELHARHNGSALPIEREFLRQDIRYKRARLQELQRRLRRDYPGSTHGFFPLPDAILSTLEDV